MKVKFKTIVVRSKQQRLGTIDGPIGSHFNKFQIIKEVGKHKKQDGEGQNNQIFMEPEIIVA